MDRTLRPREEAILVFMKKEITQKGYPPTVRELCAELGVKSTSTIHKDLERLEAKGFIRKNPAKPRALMLTEAAHRAVGDQVASPQASARKVSSTGKVVDRIDVIDLPVVGTIAAGLPILAEEHTEDYFPVPARYVNGESFMLIIKGDSMVEVVIHDGDYVLIKKQDLAQNGDIVAAMVEGIESEATVKTFYREDGRFRLQPENSVMDPIYVDEVKILGLVKGVFRFFN
ncbi:MAG: transcriptional repressor LexA [Clostridiales Family XIII bacterium]|jgi:repressor LexA|nr:transcriptional repressor LexA [Clostridiales Family XIII bacterium]